MFTPARGVKSPFYLPPAEQLPAGFPRWLTFHFPAVGAFQTQQLSLTVNTRTLIWAISEVHDQAAGYLLQIFHQHGEHQRQFLNTASPQTVAAGRASVGNPLFLRETELVEPGDVVTVEINSLANANGFVQVCLIAVELE